MESLVADVPEDGLCLGFFWPGQIGLTGVCGWFREAGNDCCMARGVFEGELCLDEEMVAIVVVLLFKLGEANLLLEAAAMSLLESFEEEDTVLGEEYLALCSGKESRLVLALALAFPFALGMGPGPLHSTCGIASASSPLLRGGSIDGGFCC